MRRKVVWKYLQSERNAQRYSTASHAIFAAKMADPNLAACGTRSRVNAYRWEDDTEIVTTLFKCKRCLRVLRSN